MIRINLLAVERGAAKRTTLIPAAHRVTIASALVLIGTVLVIGWWFWWLRSQSQQVDQDLARAESELAQVRSVLAQVQKFEAQRAASAARDADRTVAQRADRPGARHRRDRQGRARP